MNSNLFNNNTYKITIVLVVILLSLITPIGMLILLMIIAWIQRAPTYYKRDIAIFTCFIFLVQSTRPMDIETDWLAYQNAFVSVSSYSLPDYIESFNQPDIVWYILNYVSYYILGGSFKFFGEIIVLSTYLFTFISMYLYWKRSQTPYVCFLCSIAVLTFFSTLLTTSNNLLRQQFAVSLIMFFLSLHVFSCKKTWPLLLLPIFCHTMTIAFLPLYFLDLYKKISLRSIVFLVACTLLLSYLISNLAFFSFLEGLYAYERLVTGKEVQNDDIINTSVLYSYGIVMLLFYIKSIFVDKEVNRYTIYTQNSSMLLVILCVLFAGMPMFVTRYYIARVFFMPFIIPYLLARNQSYLNNIYVTFVVIFFSYLFFVESTQYINTHFFNLIYIHLWNIVLM